MANLQKFTLSDSWKDWSITLEVDLDILTVERATEINEFWSDADYRLRQANGDVVLAVIKMAAARFIYAFLEIGGACVTKDEGGNNWTTTELQTRKAGAAAKRATPSAGAASAWLAQTLKSTSILSSRGHDHGSPQHHPAQRQGRRRDLHPARAAHVHRADR